MYQTKLTKQTSGSLKPEEQVRENANPFDSTEQPADIMEHLEMFQQFCDFLKLRDLASAQTNASGNNNVNSADTAAQHKHNTQTKVSTSRDGAISAQPVSSQVSTHVYDTLSLGSTVIRPDMLHVHVNNPQANVIPNNQVTHGSTRVNPISHGRSRNNQNNPIIHGSGRYNQNQVTHGSNEIARDSCRNNQCNPNNQGNMRLNQNQYIAHVASNVTSTNQNSLIGYPAAQQYTPQAQEHTTQSQYTP